MKQREAYKGYKSYQYLDYEDYEHFKLAKELDRVEPYVLPLSEEEEKRFARIMKEGYNISLHDHPSVIPEDLSELMAYERQGREATGFEGLSRSYWDAIFDNCMDGTCIMSSKSGWKWNDVIHDMAMRSCDIAHQDFLIKGYGIEDIYRAKREGKIAWFLVMEGAAPIENELDRIEILYGLGLRMCGITYSESNHLGSGIKEDNDGGLTMFGKEAVDRMNKVGMAIDLSHTGNKTSLDVINCSKHPIFITHVGAQSLWNSKRHKPDDVLRACADKGGVIGVEAAPHTTITEKRPKHSIESVMEHFEYIKDLVGIDHVAFGPDTFYGDHVGLHHIFSKNMSSNVFSKKNSSEESLTKTFVDDVEYVLGVENPTEASYNFVRWLIKHNYGDEEIFKAMGGNVIRVLKEVWY